MHKPILVIARITLLLVITLFTYGCTPEGDLDNLSEILYVRHKNADMPAHIYGNGSEKIFLITLHGGPGGLGLNFRSPMFKERIESEYAVVYFDQRGSGISQGNYNGEDVSLDLMAEDVLALVKVLKAKYGDDSRFFLLGHSFGGTLGTATLLKDQSDFLGWIEIGGANHPFGVYFENIINYQNVANEQIALGNSVTYWESVQELVSIVDQNVRTTEDFRKLNSETVAAERTLRRDGIINRESNTADIIFDYNLLTAYWNIGTIQSIEEEFFGDNNFIDRLSEITTPSLLLWGRYDMVVPLSMGTTAFENIGATSKELVIFERSGHSPMASEPNLFADELLRFMDENK